MIRSSFAGRPRRLVALLLVIGATLVAGLSGAAYAFWTTSGSGSGTASAGSAVALTVSVTNVTGVYPNQKTTVPVSVTNTNPFSVTLSNLTLDSVVATGTGCTNTDVSLDGSASGVVGSTYTVSGSLTKAGGATPTANFNVPIAVADLANTCQGAGHSFSLTFTVHGQSG
jgi:hypothetical protein